MMSEPHDQAHPALKHQPAAQRRRRSAPWGWHEWVMLPCILLLGGFIVMGIVSEWRSQGSEDPLRCARNLRQIGWAIKLYAFDHAGALPPSLAALYPEIAPGCLVCPESGVQAADGPTTQAITTALADPAHISYTYLGRGMTASMATEDAILVHCRPEYHGGRGLYVLYGDGHVDWVDNIEARRILGAVAAGHNPPHPATAPASAPASD